MFTVDYSFTQSTDSFVLTLIVLTLFTVTSFTQSTDSFVVTLIVLTLLLTTVLLSPSFFSGARATI